jgi:hypothetical protein
MGSTDREGSCDCGVDAMMEKEVETEGVAALGISAEASFQLR